MLRSSIILKIFPKRLTPMERQKLDLTRFILESILCSLSLETGTVNNNLMIKSTSLQPLTLDAVTILRNVTRYVSLQPEKEPYLQILLIRTIVSQNQE